MFNTELELGLERETSTFEGRRMRIPQISTSTQYNHHGGKVHTLEL